MIRSRECKKDGRLSRLSDLIASHWDVFKPLSSNNRKIAQVLFDSQSIRPDGRYAKLLDQIATAKAKGAAWKGIPEQLQADGLIVESELGPIMAKHRRKCRRTRILDQVVMLDG